MVGAAKKNNAVNHSAENISSIGRDDLFYIVRGACLLGSGGGGGYNTGMQLARNFGRKPVKAKKGSYYPETQIRVVDFAQLKNSTITHGLIVAYMGAPEKMAQLQYPRAAEAAVRRAIQSAGLDVSECCIVPAEIGPISSAVACLTAARMQIPVLDGDGAGRAVPTLELCTFSQGVSVNPTIIASEPVDADPQSSSTQYIELNISNPTASGAAAKIESLARPILSMPEYDQMAGLAMWVMPTKQILELALPGTLSLCRSLGECIEKASGTPQMIQNFLNQQTDAQGYKCKILFTGKLQEAGSSTQGGFDHGFIHIATEKKSTATIVFQNESLLLWDSALIYPLATAPNLIAYVIPGKQPWVYTNADIMADGKLRDDLLNQDVAVMVIEAPQKLLHHERLLIKKRFDLSRIQDQKSTLPDNYRSELATLGYHGDFVPFPSLTKK